MGEHPLALPAKVELQIFGGDDRAVPTSSQQMHLGAAGIPTEGVPHQHGFRSRDFSPVMPFHRDIGFIPQAFLVGAEVQSRFPRACPEPRFSSSLDTWAEGGHRTLFSLKLHRAVAVMLLRSLALGAPVLRFGATACPVAGHHLTAACPRAGAPGGPVTPAAGNWRGEGRDHLAFVPQEGPTASIGALAFLTLMLRRKSRGSLCHQTLLRSSWKATER